MPDIETGSRVEIRAAGHGDRRAVEELLVGNSLPTAGVPATLDGFFVAQNGDDVIGATGLERWGSYGLLRSVAVDERWRGRAIGRRLVERALDDAVSRRMEAVYLLTTTAFQRPGRTDPFARRSNSAKPVRKARSRWSARWRRWPRPREA